MIMFLPINARLPFLEHIRISPCLTVCFLLILIFTKTVSFKHNLLFCIFEERKTKTPSFPPSKTSSGEYVMPIILLPISFKRFTSQCAGTSPSHSTPLSLYRSYRFKAPRITVPAPLPKLSTGHPVPPAHLKSQALAAVFPAGRKSY